MATTDFLRRVRFAAWAAVAITALAAGAALLGEAQRANILGSAGAPPATARVGAPFELTGTDGKRFNSAALAGKPFAIFFGFTHCPDICPTTLLEMTNHLKALGERASQLNVLFVSIDPERDTADHLKLYLSAFDPRIIGLTGTKEEIASIAKSFRAVYERVPNKDGSDYTMNHTASVYLMDKAGRLVSTLSFEEPEETRQRKIDNLLTRG
ncbi:MAG: SCO family protein [Hyphomicrobiaceae bacterium]|nr:SCO family protein [Hyphomicrobiaceae bacterium]